MAKTFFLYYSVFNRDKEIEESWRVNLFFYYRLSTQFMVSLQVWLWYCSDLHILMWSNFTINIPSFILGRRLSMYRPKLSKTLDCRIFVDFNTWKKITSRLEMPTYIYVKSNGLFSVILITLSLYDIPMRSLARF